MQNIEIEPFQNLMTDVFSGCVYAKKPSTRMCERWFKALIKFKFEDIEESFVKFEKETEGSPPSLSKIISMCREILKGKKVKVGCCKKCDGEIFVHGLCENHYNEIFLSSAFCSDVQLAIEDERKKIVSDWKKISAETGKNFEEIYFEESRGFVATKNHSEKSYRHVGQLIENSEIIENNQKVDKNQKTEEEVPPVNLEDQPCGSGMGDIGSLNLSSIPVENLVDFYGIQEEYDELMRKSV